MKTYKKILLILLLILIITITIEQTVLATGAGLDIDVKGDYWKPNSSTSEGPSRIAKMTGIILATIRNIGAIVSVIALLIIGLKYMIGSIEEKAQYKEHMVLYIVGCFLLASATTIPSLVFDMLN